MAVTWRIPIMKKEEEKTNVMRILDQKKVKYTPHSYDPEQAISGTEVATILGQDKEACV